MTVAHQSNPEPTFFVFYYYKQSSKYNIRKHILMILCHTSFLNIKFKKKVLMGTLLQMQGNLIRSFEICIISAPLLVFII